MTRIKSHKLTGRTKVALDGKLAEMRERSDLDDTIRGTFGDLRRATIVILPPKLTGRRSWEAVIHGPARRAS